MRDREAGKRAVRAVASSTTTGPAAKGAAGAVGAAAGKGAVQPDGATQRAERLRRIQERVAVARPAPPERAAPETFDDEAENRRGRDMIFDDDVVEERRYRSPDEAAESE